jgi:hypothetical protein
LENPHEDSLMPTFNNAKDLGRHLKKALDALQAETLITCQSELGSTKVSPYQTGRFRSSWFAAEGSPGSAVASEGTDSPNTDATGLRVDASKEYHLTNSLVYAQSVAIEGKVVSQPKNWFFDFQGTRIPKIQEAAARVVGKRFDLL